MRKTILIAMAIASMRLFAQPVIIPPELYWWVNAVEKMNDNYSVYKFRLTKDECIELKSPALTLDKIYPIFRRWNYSGNNVAGFNVGIVLKQEMDGRYSIINQTSYSLVVFADNQKYQYREDSLLNGKINGIAWLKDDTLIAVKSEIVGVDATTAELDIAVVEYTINGNRIRRREFIQSMTMVEVGDETRLDWMEMRKDYFVPR